MPKTATNLRTSRQASTELSGPASLVNVEARNLTKCRICGSERVTSIAMTLTDVEVAATERSNAAMAEPNTALARKTQGYGPEGGGEAPSGPVGPSIAEANRLLAENPGPEVRKVLEDHIAAVKKMQRDRAVQEEAEARAAEIERTARQTTDPALQKRLLAEADKLRGTKPIPKGEVTEGQPPIASDAPTKPIPKGEVIEGEPTPEKVPVGKTIEGQPEIKTDTPKKIPAGKVVELSPEEEAKWRKEFGLGDGDAQRAKDVHQALQHDEAAVERAAVQHEHQPVAFDREIARINEEAKNANESQRAAESSESPAGAGSPPVHSDSRAAPVRAGEADKPVPAASAEAGRDTQPEPAAAVRAADEQPRPDSVPAAGRGDGAGADTAGGQASAGAEGPGGVKSAADLSREMSEMQKTKPRPLAKLFGTKGPTPAQKLAYDASVRKWNSEYRKLSTAQKAALDRDNAAFRAAQEKPNGPDTKPDTAGGQASAGAEGPGGVTDLRGYGYAIVKDGKLAESGTLPSPKFAAADETTSLDYFKRKADAAGGDLYIGGYPDQPAWTPPKDLIFGMTWDQLKARQQRGGGGSAPVNRKMPADAVRVYEGKPNGPDTKPDNQPGDLQQKAGEKSVPKDEPPEEIFSAEKEAPFYSPLENAVNDLKLGKAGVDQWINTLRSLKGVKAEEIEWSGVNDWLKAKGGSVTKAELQQFLKDGGVKVQEVQKGALKGGFDQKAQERLDELENMRDRTDAEDAERQRLIRAENDSHDGAGIPETTKYQQYQLPGGTNYREVLLTLPKAEGSPGFNVFDPATQRSKWFSTRGEATRFADESPGAVVTEEPKPGTGNNYKSPHWDEPNVLAHIRLNDRTDAAGRKVLFVEELQSDWAQQGKKKGFAQEGPKPEERAAAQKELNEADAAVDALYQEGRAATANRKALRDKYDRMLDESERHPVESRREEAKQALVELEKLRDAEADKSRGFSDRNLAAAERLKAAHEAMRELDRREAAKAHAIPAAPFVQNTTAWTSLAIKRIAKMAADEGYDRVAFINGEQSAARYDLSKHVDSITHDGDWLEAHDKNGDRVMHERVEPTAAAMEEYIGKEPAQKLEKAYNELNAAKKYEREQWSVEKDEDSAYGNHHIVDPNGEYLHGYGGELVHYRNAEDAEAHIDRMLAEDSERENEPAHISGLDLKVGGEGMKAFYDKIVPNVAKDVVRKLGGDGLTESKMLLNPADGGGTPMRGAEYGTQTAFDITPKMREAAAGGVPLFKGEADAAGAKPLGSPEAVEAVLREKFGNKLIDGLHEQGLIKYALAMDENAHRNVKAVMRQKAGEAPAATLYFDRITAERAPGILMHELGEHFGIVRMLGNERYRVILNEMENLRDSGNAEVSAAWDHVRDNYVGEHNPGNLVEGGDVFMREVAARLVEVHPDLPLVRRIVNEIRAFFYEQFGTTLGGRVDADLLRGLAASALRKASQGSLPGQAKLAGRAGKTFTPFVPSGSRANASIGGGPPSP